MLKHHRLVPTALVALAIAIAGCGETAAPSTGVVAPTSPVLRAASASPDAPAPTAPKTTEPAPASQQAGPAPSPRYRLATWSTKPRRIFSGSCQSHAATVDESGHFHVAAICEGRIRYATSSTGRTWKTSTLPAPPSGFDIDPQLAIDGATAYLAWTHLRPVEPDTCGGDVIQDVAGIDYRSRSLPNGSWSTIKRLGNVGDSLQSLRVVNGTIHETFRIDDSTGPVFYGSLRGSTFKSIRLPEAEATSLRVGDDGRPRIAYTTGAAVRYAVLTGEEFATTTIFSHADAGTLLPVLVLGTGDRAYVSWAATRGPPVEGCGDTAPPSLEGTWFATDADGRWVTKRLSKHIGSASLALDVSTERVHAIYHDDAGIRYVTRGVDGTWSGSRLKVPNVFADSVLRRDASTGKLLLVAESYDFEAQPGLFALTAP